MERVQTIPVEEQRLRMSYEEYLDWSGEDTYAEWVDGEVIVFMPAKPEHQSVINFLSTLLTNFVRFLRLGEVSTAPLEMRIRSGGSSREPDILFVTQENLSRITKDRLEGPADLIVEVVSTDSVSRDRSDKFYEYQEGGVREYWVLDPRPGKERADFWVLDEDGRYQPIPIGEDGIYHSTVIQGFWLRVEWLWMVTKPDPILTFAEIADLSPEIIAALRESIERRTD